MRRSTKVFAFMMAAALVASACGGDSDGSSGSLAPGDTESVDSAPDATDGEDRDRNVQVGGWGEDGSGFATVSVNDRVWTDVVTRVFRRARTEVIEKRKYVNTRDVFVATLVTRFESDAQRVFLKVAGFDTAGDDVTKYPIAGFGTDGVVTVDLSSDDPNRNPIPTAWTVVSRELVAVYFRNRADEPQDRGVVEYYNLATGEREKNLGIDGRTTIPLGVPIQLITDLGLRRVDDDGTVRLVVAGIVDYGENESIAVFGFTPDGTFDPFVGDEGAGVLDFGGIIPSAGNFSRIDVRLSDPGVGGAPGIGVIVVSNDNDTVDEENDVPATQLLTFIVVREDATTKAVKMTNRGFFFRTLGLQVSNSSIRNASLSSTGGFSANITGNPPGMPWGRSAPVHYKIQASSSREIVDVVYEQLWESGDDEILQAHGGMITNVSQEGRDFVVKNFKNMETGRFETRVCFSLLRCYEKGTTGSIDLIEAMPLDDYYAAIGSMSVNADGVHAVVRFISNTTDDSVFKLASIDPLGTGAGDVSPILDTSFYTIEYPQGEGEGWFYPTKQVFAPRPLGKGAVAALQFDTANKSLRLQTVGQPAIDGKLSRPFGGEEYSGSDLDFAVFDSTSVGLVAYFADEDQFEARLYKLDVTNGSVDTGFGKDGYVLLPNLDLHACGADVRLLSTGGTVTRIIAAYEEIVTDGLEECSQQPTTITWQTFDAKGVLVGSGGPGPLVPDERIVGYASDGRGALFYLTEQYNYTEDDEYLGRTIRVKKLTTAGVLDPTFATQGVLTIEDVDAPTQIALDDQGRLYVGMILYDRLLQVSRYTAAGVLDVPMDVEPTPPTLAPNSQVTLPPQATLPPAERLARDRFVEEQEKEQLADLPPGDGLTVTASKPVITSARPTEDRSLTVTWGISAAAGSPYVTATAMPGGRSCTSNTDSCVIRGLDPSQKYTVTVALKGEMAATGALSVTATPVVSMKIGRVASPTTFVRPASRGTATWKVRGGCTLNATNTRIAAPQRAATCQLSVTTAKFGSTPKTTKSVTIVVKK